MEVEIGGGVGGGGVEGGAQPRVLLSVILSNMVAEAAGYTKLPRSFTFVDMINALHGGTFIKRDEAFGLNGVHACAHVPMCPGISVPTCHCAHYTIETRIENPT